VLTDPELLRSLSGREFRGGLAEVIKHAIIADAEMFAMLEKDMEKVLRRDRQALSLLIPRNVEIKARVVSRDERESGLREILNYGHTFAHALESVTKYRRYQHGEAVAWGMIAAAFLGHELGLTRADDVSRIVALIHRLGALPPWPRVPAAALLRAMRADKKTRSGILRFVLSPASVKRVPTTPSRFTLSSAFSISRPALLLQAASFREGPVADVARPSRGLAPKVPSQKPMLPIKFARCHADRPALRSAQSCSFAAARSVLAPRALRGD